MLVVVPGATGKIGQYLIDALHARGHQVRALGRSLSSLSPERKAKLHSSVSFKSYDDIPALDEACKGADAVIVAYRGTPELAVDGQLHLLRAAERAGIKRFIASSWCYDFRALPLGGLESYDPFKMFQLQAAMTSSIKPTYILSGVLAEVFFSMPGYVDFSTRALGPWDNAGRRIEAYGTGDEVWHWTNCRDAAEFAADIIGQDEAEEGGFWSVASGTFTLKELAAVYEKVRGKKVEFEIKGTVEELREKALKGRADSPLQGFWGYVGAFYHLYTVDGSYILHELDNEKLGTKRTSLEEFLLENPSI